MDCSQCSKYNEKNLILIKSQLTLTDFKATVFNDIFILINYLINNLMFNWSCQLLFGIFFLIRVWF